MSDSQATTQLEMVWPYRHLSHVPVVNLPSDYGMRTYQPGDETRFYEVMALAGWPGWSAERLNKWVWRILPESWFMVVHQPTNQIVSTAMALHSHEDNHPFGGELGWVACDPAHRGLRLGLTVSAAVTARLLNMGYRHIHLYTEDFRLAALKTYLGLGYVPFINGSDHHARWQAIHKTLHWPYMPEEWGY